MKNSTKAAKVKAKKTDDKKSESSVSKTISKAKSENKNDLKKPKRVFKKSLLGFLIIAVLAGGVYAGFKAYEYSKTLNKIGEADISDIATYSYVNNSKVERLEKSSFTFGEQIQVGFKYTRISEEQAEDALVRFVVVDDDHEEVFVTSLFRLNPLESELYVNINNVTLKPGDYTVELKNKDDKYIASQEFTIKK